MNASSTSLDLRSGTTEAEVKATFATAESNIEKSAKLKTEAFLSQEINSKKIKFFILLGLCILIGFLAMKVFGAIIAGSFIFASVAILWFFWNYKLPTIIKNAEADVKIKTQDAINREKEMLKKMELEHLERLKNIVKNNPIEQAEFEFLRRGDNYKTFKRAMEKIGGKVNAFGTKISNMQVQRPNMDLSQEREAHKKMQFFYSSRLEMLNLAYQKLILFKDKIEQARIKWDFQLDANEALRAMNSVDRDARINEILTSLAFDVVQQEFEAIFTKLDLDAIEIRNGKIFDFDGQTLDMSDVYLPK